MPLLETELDPDPFVQFERWFDDAKGAGIAMPEAMTVATTGLEGEVSSRVCLLKSFDHRGFVFFTNYHSRKGKQIHDNPRAALVFWWQSLERQVRIEGAVVRTTEEESDEYFATRPRGSQLGAWASEQSHVLAGRGALDGRFEELSTTYRDVAIPRPPHWGGYRVIPLLFEFWQGRSDRLHDRFWYRLRNDVKDWVVERLSP
ncbi:MAG: pyridoxamine 5-phosphate oxidase [Thermoanaerobaculia bacterium]|jgi:pyridoxamine 5'-phosphate oxidase|nr:pyridoxamine 5-phosphate oxidase [Thermoanaerobaculia bacterium]